MDTSETYIKMCDCEEIQKEWHPRDWDFVLTKDLWPKVFGGDDYVWCLLPEDIADSGVYGSYATDKGIGGYPGYIKHWLPRQDQLQEMVGGLEKGFIDFPKWLENTYGLNYGDYPNGHLCIFKTWEQLWLAFVMKEKYNKVWDGEEWG